jgi:vancomycin resistance protein YoaR
VASALGPLAARLRTTRLAVRVAGKAFELEPAEVDYQVDLERTVASALGAGRSGNVLGQLGWWLGRLGRPAELRVVGALAPDKLEQRLRQWEGEAIADPPFEGAIVARDGRPAADYPRVGRAIDRQGVVALVLDGWATERSEPIDLPLHEVEPHHGRAAIDEALHAAERLCAGPVTLSATLPALEPPQPLPPSKPDKDKTKTVAVAEPEPTPAPEVVRLELSREQLVAALRSRPSGDAGLGLALSFDPEVVGQALAALGPKLARTPQNAKLVVDAHDEVRIVPSQAGTRIDPERVAAAALAAAGSPDRSGVLPVEAGAEPELTTEQARGLHVEHLVGEFTTRHACCQPRVQNIHRIADLVDGTIVQPGDTLSLNAVVGQRTKQAGFVEAPTIEEGEMKDSIGGGISQFTTTLFNAAFRAGYDIVERTPHSFYFSRYPMGFDATLSYPHPDLQIRNDTTAGLLIKTSYDKTSITVKLYGEVAGRKVLLKKTPPTDIVHPPTRYTPNPERKPDSEKVHYSGQVGWSVYVSRTITFADGTSKTEKRKVSYKPRPREVEVHPCRIPKGEDGYTGAPCPEPVAPLDEDAGPPPEQPGVSRQGDSAEGLIPPSLVEGEKR